MASLHVSPEELSCPVCCEIFKSPVLLSCGHSFCKECLQQFWRRKGTQECPVCRRRSSNEFILPNMALKNLCESFLKDRDKSHSSGPEEICSLHREKLKLFCMEHNQPVCVVCRDSQKHANHTFKPFSEIGPSYKEELKSLKEKPKHKESIKGEKTVQHTKNINDLIKKSILIGDGNPARYRLQTKIDRLDQSKPYKKMTFGERDKNKPHKTILMVGETGTGKTTLINAMINYMLCVKRKDKVWFEITDDQSDRTSAHSQTSSITVYGFYLQESLIDLTIIDTPGYGDTRGVDLDKQIAESLLSLNKSAEGVHEIHAVCLVIKATQTRLSDRQMYIFDAVQSLFGRDTAENIVLLFTHSSGARPKNALTAVKEAKVKCAVNDKNQPVFFLFDNCQLEADDEDDEDREQRLDRSWDLSFRGMAGLFKFLYTIQPKSLMLRDVLQKRKQLEANISNLQSRVQMMELKQMELKQIKEVLEKNKEYVKNKNSLVQKLEEELQELEKEKIKLVIEAFHCVETLEKITLNTDSLLTLLHVDFLIEKLKEINEPEKAEILENIKKRAGEGKQGALGYITRLLKK